MEGNTKSAGPVQIVNSDEETKLITLNEDVLQAILMQEEIKDKYACVISIAGAFRQGKSFLLNFFVRYLQVTYNLKRKNVKTWLDSKDGRLAGFDWKSGSKRHTTGILMWSEIFIAKTATNKEVAIILLDTQGSFDNKSTTTECATIFALSTLISSVQIYNLKENIKQYDLSHLECFTGYAGLIVEESDTKKSPFQNLWFLIRDWSCPDEKHFGAKGGQQLLNDVLNTDDKQASELLLQKNNVKELFKKIKCFLLPHPGMKVATSNNFQGDLNDVDFKFKEHVQELVYSILAPEHLVPKTINGEKITVGQLLSYIISYGKAFKDNKMPKLQSLFEATVEAQHESALTDAEDRYKLVMEFMNHKDYKPLKETALKQIHEVAKCKALEYFRSKKKMGTRETSATYEAKLEQKLEERFSGNKKLNEFKAKIQRGMLGIFQDGVEEFFASAGTIGATVNNAATNDGPDAGLRAGFRALARGVTIGTPLERIGAATAGLINIPLALTQVGLGFRWNDWTGFLRTTFGFSEPTKDPTNIDDIMQNVANTFDIKQELDGYKEEPNQDKASDSEKSLDEGTEDFQSKKKMDNVATGKENKGEHDVQENSNEYDNQQEMNTRFKGTLFGNTVIRNYVWMVVVGIVIGISMQLISVEVIYVMLGVGACCIAAVILLGSGKRKQQNQRIYNKP